MLVCFKAQSLVLSLMCYLYTLSLTDLIPTYDIKYHHPQYSDDFQIYLFSLELSLNSRFEYTATPANLRLDTNRHLRLNLPSNDLLISPAQTWSPSEENKPAFIHLLRLKALDSSLMYLLPPLSTLCTNPLGSTSKYI